MEVSEEEVWKIVPNHSRYEVSSFGRIKDLKDGEIKSPLLNGGFLCLNIVDNIGNKYLGKVHRLVALAFLEDPVSWKRIGHRDEDKTNNHYKNLFWITPKAHEPREIKFIKYKGINFEIKMFADMCKMTLGELNGKMSKGWTAEDCKIGFNSFKGPGLETGTHWFPNKSSKQSFLSQFNRKAKELKKKEMLQKKLERQQFYSGLAWEVRIKNHCEEVGYEFISSSGQGISSTLKAFCSQHGVFIRKVNQIIYKNFKFCPGCIKDVKDTKSNDLENQMLAKITAKSNYPEGSLFKKNLNKVDSHGRYKYWDVYCSLCKSSCTAHQSDIQRGYLSCECSKLAQKQAYINLIKDGDIPLCLKFGISSNYEDRLRVQRYNNNVHIENIGVWGFEDRESCRLAESECKDALTCKIIDKSLMPDGFTETTYLYNLGSIISIYQKYGGIKI